MKILLNVLLAAILGASVFLAASLTVSAATLPKVTSVKAYNIDDDEINLKWKAVKGADGYQVKSYEISFEYGRYDYEYTVNARTGKTVRWEKEID